MFRLRFLTTARVCLMVLPAEEYDKHNMSILI
jgi:hypothetical protein